MTFRTEITCPTCSAYDSFESRSLASWEGFYHLAKTPLYVCSNCGFSFVSDDEFRSDSIPDHPLAWTSPDVAINDLRLFEERLSQSQGKGSAKQANDKARKLIEEVAEMLALASPHSVQGIRLLDNKHIFTLEHTKWSILERLNGLQPTYLMQSIAVARVDSEKQCQPSYLVMYKVLPVTAYKPDGVTVDAVQLNAFAENVEPLFWLPTSELKVFIRLAVAPEAFLKDGLQMLRKHWNAKGSDDSQWGF